MISMIFPYDTQVSWQVTIIFPLCLMISRIIPIYPMTIPMLNPFRVPIQLINKAT